MSKITLNNVGSLIDTTTAQATVNANFDVIEDAFDNTLSRDGDQPNTMNANIDMNSHRIFNLPIPVSLSEPLRLADLAELSANGSISLGQGNAASIAALRFLSPGQYSSVDVMGYYAAGDGGGGTFYWDATSTSADDGGSVIAPDVGGTGRWKRTITLDRVYTPEMFGAHADGTNDRLYIQATIDALSNLGGGKIKLSPKTYTVSGLSSNNTSVLEVKSKVSIDGAGEASVIKLADNTNVANSVFTATFVGGVMTVTAMTSGTITVGQYLSNTALGVQVTQVTSQIDSTHYNVTHLGTFASPLLIKGVNKFVDVLGSYFPSSIDNTSYSNFLVDYNGANNCAGGTIWSENAVFRIAQGSNIEVDGVRFRNNSGSNTLVFGSLTTPSILTDVKITNCSFSNDGDAVNPVAVDYSTIFIDATDVEISNNQLFAGPTINGAAFEVYGANINIVGNTIRNYFNVLNVVSISTGTTANVNFVGNTCLDVNCGAVIFALTSTAKLDGLNITGNVFRGTDISGPSMVNGIDAVHNSAIIRNVLISSNVYQQFGGNATFSTPAISLKSFYSAKISNNLIWGVPGPGIHLVNAGVNASVEVINNQLLNVGYNTSTGIVLDAAATVNTLNVSGNTINPIGVYTIATGIENHLSAVSGNIRNNIFQNVTTPIVNTGAGVTSETGTGAMVLAASPALTGTPTAPTAAGNDSSTQIANTAWYMGQKAVTAPLIDTAVAAIGGSAKWAAADHQHPTDTSRAPVASPTFTGTVTIPNGSVLNTPASVNLSNATALPIGSVTGLATGVSAFLATPSSSNLKAAVTDETGSGALVFATSPALVTPTGIVKADVGLGNVDNTSDTTKNAAAVTLTNKTLTSPVINTPTGIVKGDVGLGNVDNTSDSTKNTAVVALTNKDLTSGTNSFPTLNQNTTGSAAKLTTARTIDGQSFDGTANVTVIAPGTHAATTKAIPVDADEIPLVDTAASNVLKKLTWSNLKATLGTNRAVLNAAPANPTGTASATLVMMGLGSTCTLTPSNTGRIRFTISGAVSNSVAGDGAQFRMAYGTGTAPVNGAALTGTVFGSAAVQAVGGGGGAPMFLPFTTNGIATGLTAGVAYWFDLQLAAVTGGTASIQSLSCVAEEI